MSASNPPAFPRSKSAQPEANRQHWSVDEGAFGMDLRDYFAAKFAHAELNTAGASHAAANSLVKAAAKDGRSIEQQIAHNAYTLADAMLTEREKGTK